MMESTFQQALTFFFPQFVLIVAAAPICAYIAKRLGQPAPVGWIMAGVLLGPSGFGQLAPAFFEWFFLPYQAGRTTLEVSQTLMTMVEMIAELGLILFLFQMGAEFDFSKLCPREVGRMRSATGVVAISMAGIIVPMALALLISPILHKAVGGDTSFWGFALFLAIAMSITALPILAFIMKEFGFARTRIGVCTITCGANDDAVGWVLLGVITAWVKSQYNWQSTLITLGWLLLYATVMVKVISPKVTRWLTQLMEKDPQKRLPSGAYGVLAALLLMSAYATHMMGIFGIFGAFMMGACISAVPGIRHEIEDKFATLTNVFFLPVFFTATGLRMDVGGISSWQGGLMLLLILLVAVGGKLGGCALAARCFGFSTRESLCIGSLMNCRALMELVALNVGLSLGVLSQEIFTMLVIMALITTIMTMPLVRLWGRGTELEEPLGLTSEEPIPNLERLATETIYP